MASLTLRSIPEEELDHLLNEQLLNKKEKKRQQYSLETTLLKIIKEHKDFKLKTAK